MTENEKDKAKAVAVAGAGAGVGGVGGATVGVLELGRSRGCNGTVGRCGHWVGSRCRRSACIRCLPLVEEAEKLTFAPGR
jgi:hypothetical protein